jgi:hypothetical protein
MARALNLNVTIPQILNIWKYAIFSNIQGEKIVIQKETTERLS